jgi:hypothetical protein
VSVSRASRQLLRDGLLEGISLLVVHAGEDASVGRAVADGAGELGASVLTATPDVVLGESSRVDMLVVDGDALFGAGGLGACMEGAWEATATVVNGAFLPAARGGRIVYLAPAPGAREQADAARAGLENLARTLSVEWARHEITVVTIALGERTTPGEVVALTAYLASPAGAYFSGCLLDLRGV